MTSRPRPKGIAFDPLHHINESERFLLSALNALQRELPASSDAALANIRELFQKVYAHATIAVEQTREPIFTAGLRANLHRILRIRRILAQQDFSSTEKLARIHLEVNRQLKERGSFLLPPGRQKKSVEADKLHLTGGQ